MCESEWDHDRPWFCRNGWHWYRKARRYEKGDLVCRNCGQGAIIGW